MALPIPILITLLLSLLSLSLLLLLSRHRKRRRRAPAAGDPATGPLQPLVVEDRGEGGDVEKKRKKKGRKKRGDGVGAAESGEKESMVVEEPVVVKGEDRMYPFSSFSSATQRRIKQRYDELVRSNEAKALTVAQVGQFINCLVEARNDLQQKSQVIHRKFTIAKALLYKADRPSFCRLCQQIHKLEAEQKRLEEDAVVYNRIQQQLKISPAFKTLLEIGARMEAEADSGRSVDPEDSDFTDISFEELLAQEKKDSFWQKNGKLRSCTS